MDSGWKTIATLLARVELEENHLKTLATAGVVATEKAFGKSKCKEAAD